MDALLLQWVQYFNNGYNISTMGTILLQWLQYCYNGYNIATMGTILQQWVQYCYNGYNIATMGEILQEPAYNFKKKYAKKNKKKLSTALYSSK